MSKWWKIFPWEFGKGSISPTSPCEIWHRCKNIVKAAPPLLKSDCFFGILLPLSFLGNVNVKSVCRINMLREADGNAVLFSSETGCCLFTACFNFLLLVSNNILFACDAPLSTCALCPSSFFNHYFPLLTSGNPISSDLPFLSNPWSEFICPLLPTPVHRHLQECLGQVCKGVGEHSPSPSSHHSPRLWVATGLF